LPRATVGAIPRPVAFFAVSANRDLEYLIVGLSPADRLAVDAALAADPELADDLRGLLDGQYGERTKTLFLRCFATRLPRVEQPRDALLPALADAMRRASDAAPE
jgi:hypothetical protein